MKRSFDLSVSIILLIIFAVPLMLLSIVILSTSKGSFLYWSKRIGKNNLLFFMPKFKTMKLDTPQVATHLLQDPDPYLLPFGKFLRKFSLDELPQLISIFKGDMSFVGPRPALYNQDDLIKLRVSKGLDKLKPGLTGWAQVNGRDELSIQLKVDYEVEYMERRSFSFDLYIIWLTLLKIIKKDGVSH